jgi:hypothetical protein
VASLSSSAVAVPTSAKTNMRRMLHDPGARVARRNQIL